MEDQFYWMILFQFLNRKSVLVVDWSGTSSYEVKINDVKRQPSTRD
jgi:hypothetical protein